MAEDDGVIKKTDMKPDVTYLLCPDKSCKLFWDTTRRIPCEADCPKQDELVKIIQCSGCYEPIELSGDHHVFRRVEHFHEDETISWTFKRMSGKYQLLYERPK